MYVCHRSVQVHIVLPKFLPEMERAECGRSAMQPSFVHLNFWSGQWDFRGGELSRESRADTGPSLFAFLPSLTLSLTHSLPSPLPLPLRINLVCLLSPSLFFLVSDKKCALKIVPFTFDIVLLSRLTCVSISQDYSTQFQTLFFNSCFNNCSMIT